MLYLLCDFEFFSFFKTVIQVRRDIQSPFVITDMAIVLANKGEEEPLGYSRLNENLNRGVVGSSVFIAFKENECVFLPESKINIIVVSLTLLSCQDKFCWKSSTCIPQT